MASPSALLVMRRGPGRGSLARTLREAGLKVRRAENAFEGTGEFAQHPTDLVVVDLEVLARSGSGFVRTLRARSRDAGILLLMDAGDRRSALRALREGADAYVIKPWYPEEVAVLARRLADRAQQPLSRPPPPSAGAPPASAASLRRLAHEVAHAVNNPLQVLSLHVEGLPVPPESRRLLESELRRIRDVVRGLSLPTPEPTSSAPGPASLGAVLRQALEEAHAAGRIRPVSRLPADGPLVAPAAGELRSAIASMIDLLASRSGEAPARVTGRVRRVRAGGTRHVEAVLEAEGARVAPEEIPGLGEHLLVTDDATRRSSSGLAAAFSVAEAVGGRVLLRAGSRGSVLALRLPLPTA